MIRLKNLRDRIRSSLFFVPMVYVIGAVLAGQAMLVVDDSVEGIPERLTATVDSARNVLSVTAGATLSFAGIAFSVSLLLISLASSQFSPRVVHGLFRDPFNKRVMGIVIGTFTYCLVVMRAVRGPLEEGGTSVVPSVSVLVAVVFGVVSILAIVAFISHSAHSMDVSEILHRVTSEAIGQIQRIPFDDHPSVPVDPQVPVGDGFDVMFQADGWVQQIDYGELLSALEPEATMRIATVAGRYAISDTPLGTIWPHPTEEESICRAVRNAVVIGETRTMDQDSMYGLRQLADVALKALSPGINDPTTAQDAMFHLAALLRRILERPIPPSAIADDKGRRLLLEEELTHESIISLAFDEVRVASSGQPTFQIYLLEILRMLIVALDGADHAPARAAMRQQANLVVAVSDLADLTESDHERVRMAYQSRFAG